MAYLFISCYWIAWVTCIFWILKSYFANIQISLIGYVGGVCNFFSSVSPQQKFEVMDRPVLQLSCIWQAEEDTSSRHEGGPTQKIRREERPQVRFGSSCYMFFLVRLSLPFVNWSSQENCLFHLRFSFQSSDLPLFYLCKIFPSLSFSHHHSGLIFPILTT